MPWKVSASSAGAAVVPALWPCAAPVAASNAHSKEPSLRMAVYRFFTALSLPKEIHRM
jgi:hypothetical protein